jgi:hypothetical protein
MKGMYADMVRAQQFQATVPLPAVATIMEEEADDVEVLDDVQSRQRVASITSRIIDRSIDDSNLRQSRQRESLRQSYRNEFIDGDIEMVEMEQQLIQEKAVKASYFKIFRYVY